MDTSDYSQRARSTMHMPDINFRLSAPMVPQWTGSGSQKNYNLIYTPTKNTISNAIGINTPVISTIINLQNGTTKTIQTVDDRRVNNSTAEGEWLDQTSIHRANLIASAQFGLKQYK